MASDDLHHAGPEPSTYALRSFLSGKSLDGSRAAFSLKALGMQYESDPRESDDGSICNLGGCPSPDPLQDSVHCCIVATFTKDAAQRRPIRTTEEFTLGRRRNQRVQAGAERQRQAIQHTKRLLLGAAKTKE